MIYTSKNGKDMVYAEQYKNRESIKSIKKLGPMCIKETKSGIVVDENFVEPGQFVIMTTTGMIVIKDCDIFCERFIPATLQIEMFK